MNTNVWDAFVMLFYFSYLFLSFAGTAYLIEVHKWSPWWLAFTALIVCSVKFKTGGIQ